MNSSALCQVNVYNSRDISVEGSSGEVTVFFAEHDLVSTHLQNRCLRLFSLPKLII